MKSVSIQEKTQDIGSLQWYYREIVPNQVADNPPVVLLHGLPAHSFTWVELLPVLGEYGYRAIAPDWIGFGFSSKPSRIEFSYTPEAFIHALYQFVQALELAPFSLIVQGFLASAGVQLALRYPHLIHRLVIMNTPILTSARLPWAMGQWGVPLLGEMLVQDPLLVDRTLETGSGYVILEEKLRVYRQPFLKSSAAGRSLSYTIRSLQLVESMKEIERDLYTFKKPTLLVWGVDDPWLLTAPVLELQINPALTYFPLGAGQHYPQEHWLKDMTPRMINFLGSGRP
jgi:haloalkane dehalogenase